VATYPDSTKTSLEQRLRARARDRWPQIASLQVRHRGNFSYVDATLTGATTSSCAGCAMSAPPASGSTARNQLRQCCAAAMHRSYTVIKA